MKKYIIIIFVFEVLVLYSCRKKSEGTNDTRGYEKSSNTNNTSEKKQTNKVVSKSNKIINQQNSLIIKSIYKEGEYYFEGDMVDKLVFTQKILFLFDDSVLKTYDFPVQKLDIDTGSNNFVEIQENIANSISVVKGERGWVYLIYGAGVLPNQTEFYGLYSPIGELLWYSYTTYQNYKKIQSDFPNEGYGDLDSVLEAYKISEKEFNKPKNTVNIW